MALSKEKKTRKKRKSSIQMMNITICQMILLRQATWRLIAIYLLVP